MASQTEPITTTDVLDYTGELFYVGATFGKAPILALAGLNEEAGNFSNYKISRGNQFPMANTIAGDSAAQDGVTEDASLSTSTFSSYTASQTTNYMQIFKYDWTQSYAAAALNGTISGVAVQGQEAGVDELATQRMAFLKQMIADYEYSALRGASQAWTNAATAGKMGGLVTAVEAGSETAAAGAELSKTLIDTEIARMAAAGAEFGNVVVAGNAHQIQQINNLYGNSMQSSTVGGVNLQTVLLPIAGMCRVVYDPTLATDDLVFIDLEHFSPVFGVVPGRPPVFIEQKAATGASVPEELFSLASVDYGNILWHGMVSGLATS